MSIDSPQEAQPTLGKTVRLLRERVEGDLASQKLADRARIDLRTVERIEAGGDAPWGTVASLAQAMNVSIEELADLHEEILSKEGLSVGLCSSDES